MSPYTSDCDDFPHHADSDILAAALVVIFGSCKVSREGLPASLARLTGFLFPIRKKSGETKKSLELGHFEIASVIGRSLLCANRFYAIPKRGIAMP